MQRCTTTPVLSTFEDHYTTRCGSRSADADRANVNEEGSGVQDDAEGSDAGWGSKKDDGWSTCYPSSDCDSDCDADAADILYYSRKYPAAGRGGANSCGADKAYTAFGSHFEELVGKDGRIIRGLMAVPTGRVPENLLPPDVSYATADTEASAKSNHSGRSVLRSGWKPAILTAPEGKCSFESSMQLTIEDKDSVSIWRCEPRWKLRWKDKSVTDEEAHSLCLQLQSGCKPVMDDTVRSQRESYLASMMESKYSDAVKAWHLSIPAWLYHDAWDWEKVRGWTIENVRELETQYLEGERDWTAWITRSTLSEDLEDQSEMEEDPEVETAAAVKISKPSIHQVNLTMKSCYRKG
jgi:hypothetical protein